MNKYKTFLFQAKAKDELARERLHKTQEELQNTKRTKDLAQQALDLVNIVLLTTQNQVKSFIEEVVTTALHAVFNEDYSFIIEFEIKRNKSEAYFYLQKGDHQYSLRDEVGGGVVDVVAFALRVAVWALSGERGSATFILDEPGRCVSEDKQVIFAEMLRKISDMFNIQMIIPSHSDDIIQAAHKAFLVTQTNGTSKVEVLNE